MDTPETTRVHERLDDLFAELAAIKAPVLGIQTVCTGCREAIAKHEKTIYGNGGVGLMGRMAACEQGRVDTLTVKSVCVVLGAVGALAGAIGAAMGALVR